MEQQFLVSSCQSAYSFDAFWILHMASSAVGHMISVEEAIAAIRTEVNAKSAERLALSDALGCVLAEDVCSDLDVPQNDQSIVDGYAVRAADFALRAIQAEGTDVELEILEEVTAGNVPSSTVKNGQTVRVMTGVAMPPGADAVVMIEEVECREEAKMPMGIARFSNTQVAPGQNIMCRGKSLQRGQLVLSAGAPIGGVEMGLLAQAGCNGVRVIPKPTLAVLPTGDELIDPGFDPAPGKIRNSNGPMLMGCGRQLGLDVLDLGIGRDDVDHLRHAIERGLSADVLIISGGVSAGTRDLVPQVLTEQNVRARFHKVKVKPGKPLWFGVAENAQQTKVFGLPGNPVSSFVCFQVFVRPALKQLGGQQIDPTTSLPFARLSSRFEGVGNRAVYHPAQLSWSEDGPEIECVLWHGSGDLRALSRDNALAIFPPGDTACEAGQSVAYQRLD